MLQYLIILLDDTSVSYCHYENRRTERRLIDIEDLRSGILFAMKENLNIQFVYPDYDIPQEYKDLIESIDHTKIMPAGNCDGADVVVIDGIDRIADTAFDTSLTYVLRTDLKELCRNISDIGEVLEKAARLNIVLTDIETFTEADFTEYSAALRKLATKTEELYADGKTPQLNILTDRMMLDAMNNCGAGDTNITLAPDGRFYVCPAFYLSEVGHDIGSPADGLAIANPQLYRLSHAPLCRNCDAYQCRRCVWMNRRTTLEVNTPSHEQCVTAHIERNASRELLAAIRKHGEFMAGREIVENDCLDPFDNREEW